MTQSLVACPLLVRDGVLPARVVKALLLPAGAGLQRALPTRPAGKYFRASVRILDKQRRDHGRRINLFVGLSVMYLLDGDGVGARCHSPSRIRAHKLLPRKLPPWRIWAGRHHLHAIHPRRDSILRGCVERGMEHGLGKVHSLPVGNVQFGGFSSGQSLSGWFRYLIGISNPRRRSLAHRSLLRRLIADPLRVPGLLQQPCFPPADRALGRWLTCLIPYQDLPVVTRRRSKRGSGILNLN